MCKSSKVTTSKVELPELSPEWLFAEHKMESGVSIDEDGRYSSPESGCGDSSQTSMSTLMWAMPELSPSNSLVSDGMSTSASPSPYHLAEDWHHQFPPDLVQPTAPSDTPPFGSFFESTFGHSAHAESLLWTGPSNGDYCLPTLPTLPTPFCLPPQSSFNSWSHPDGMSPQENSLCPPSGSSQDTPQMTLLIDYPDDQTMTSILGCFEQTKSNAAMP